MATWVRATADGDKILLEWKPKGKRFTEDEVVMLIGDFIFTDLPSGDMIFLAAYGLNKNGLASTLLNRDAYGNCLIMEQDEWAD